MRLKRYLDGEQLAAQYCQELHAVELDFFAQLVDLFDRLREAVKVDDSRAEIPAHLLLVVQNQLYGVVSQMSRRRVADAKALTRLAIEAAGAAKLIWDKPNLARVFVDSYQGASALAPDDPKRFLPSREYVTAFTSRELFKGDGEDWKVLRVAYGLFSATAAHAGLGATIPHKFDDYGVGSNPFADDEELRRAWYPMLRVYKAIWLVFADVLLTSCDGTTLLRLQIDFATWWYWVCDSARNRATPDSPL
jgi:hypothetical protein